MALAQYGTLITTIGLAQIANAQITQTKVGLEYIALGDGNGAHYVPTQNQTALVHEVWRGPIAELSIDPTNSNRIIVDAVIPVTAGGFTIREIGIFDDKNQLIAIGQYPEKYKPQLSEGVSEETLIHFVIETNNADVVKLNIDPTVIIASRKYVDEKVAGVNTNLTTLNTKVTEHLDQKASKTEYGHVKIGVGINVTTDGTISAAEVSDASTMQKGIVQLNDTLTSTSTTQAATANAVKQVNDKFKLSPSVNAVVETGWHSGASGQQPLYYFKDEFGIVHIGGSVYCQQALKPLIANLPVGYRPYISQAFSIVANVGTGAKMNLILVSTNGKIEVSNSNDDNYGLFLNCSFRAEGS